MGLKVRDLTSFLWVFCVFINQKMTSCADVSKDLKGSIGFAFFNINDELLKQFKETVNNFIKNAAHSPFK